MRKPDWLKEYADVTRFLPGRGVEHGPGWDHLLRRVLDDLRAQHQKLPPPRRGYLVLAKEKFGFLSIDLSRYPGWIKRSVKYAEEMSRYTCEQCGTQDGVTTSGAWVKTLCPTCRGKLV